MYGSVLFTSVVGVMRKERRRRRRKRETRSPG